MSDEYEDTYTASDYWEDMYEETMLHVKYLLETPREEAQRIFEAHLEDLIGLLLKMEQVMPLP